MPSETQPLTEVAFRGHDVDGILFMTREDGLVHGAGWQGRSFQFEPRQVDLLSAAIALVKVDPDQGKLENEYDILIKKGKNQISLKVKQNQGWVEAIGKGQNIGFAIATSDKDAIVHVLGELKILLAGSNRDASHFCKQYGVVDDD